MARALVVFCSRTGQTRKIAELIAEGLRISGVDAELTEAVKVTNVEDFAGFDAVILGSATYHGEMMQQMKTLLFLAEKAGLEGKVGGAFGAFGWSGEAPDRIYNTLFHVLKMDVVSEPLRLKSAGLQGGIQMAHDYGKAIAKKLGV